MWEKQKKKKGKGGKGKKKQNKQQANVVNRAKPAVANVGAKSLDNSEKTDSPTANGVSTVTFVLSLENRTF